MCQSARPSEREDVRQSVRQSVRQCACESARPSVRQSARQTTHIHARGPILLAHITSFSILQSPDVVQTAQLTRAPLRIVAAADALVARLAGPAAAAAAGATFAAFAAKDGRAVLVQLQHDPLRVDLFVEGFGAAGAAPLPAVSVNARGLAYFEHRRSKDGGADAAGAATGGVADPRGKIVDWDEAGKAIYEDGSHGGDEAHAAHPGGEAVAAPAAGASDADSLWAENFKEHADSKPFGPTSVGVDVSFPHATFAFGVPEHASSHALHATDGSDANAAYREPYRLYNLDVFEYELDNPMALYGSIPMLLAHAPSGSTAGAFWNNPTETYVDIAKPSTAGAGVATRWISESGVFDLFLLAGPAPKSALFQFTQAVGTQGLPPLFALGYHQCAFSASRKREDEELPSAWPARGCALGPFHPNRCFVRPPPSPPFPLPQVAGTTRTRRTSLASTPSSRSTPSPTTCCGSTLSTRTASAISRGTARSSRSPRPCRTGSRRAATRWSRSLTRT